MSIFSFEESEFLLRVKAKGRTRSIGEYEWDDDWDYYDPAEDAYHEPVNADAQEAEDILNDYWDRMHDQDRRAALKRKIFGP